MGGSPVCARSLNAVPFKRIDARSIHVPLQGKEVGEVGGRVYVYFHDRVHPLAPPLICLAVRQVLLGLLDVVRLEVPEEGEAIAEDGVVADAGLPERLDHLCPDLLVAAHVLFFVPRSDLQNPRILGHPALLILVPPRLMILLWNRPRVGEHTSAPLRASVDPGGTSLCFTSLTSTFVLRYLLSEPIGRSLTTNAGCQ